MRIGIKLDIYRASSSPPSTIAPFSTTTTMHSQSSQHIQYVVPPAPPAQHPTHPLTIHPFQHCGPRNTAPRMCLRSSTRLRPLLSPSVLTIPLALHRKTLPAAPWRGQSHRKPALLQVALPTTPISKAD